MKKIVSLILMIAMLMSSCALAEINADRFLSQPDNSLLGDSIMFGVNDMTSRKNGNVAGLMVMLCSPLKYLGNDYPVIVTMFGADRFIATAAKVLTDTHNYTIMDVGGPEKIGLQNVNPLSNMLVDKTCADMFRDMATSKNVQFTLMGNGQTYDFELTDVQKNQLLLIADAFNEEIWPYMNKESDQYNFLLTEYLKNGLPSIGVSARMYETLQKGSKGAEVKALQAALIELGYLSGKADGAFGNGTMAAVQAFQEAEGLEATGIADHNTQMKLFSK